MKKQRGMREKIKKRKPCRAWDRSEWCIRYVWKLCMCDKSETKIQREQETEVLNLKWRVFDRDDTERQGDFGMMKYGPLVEGLVGGAGMRRTRLMEWRMKIESLNGSRLTGVHRRIVTRILKWCWADRRDDDFRVIGSWEMTRRARLGVQ